MFMDVTTIKQRLIDCLSSTMSKGLDKADTKEMGEVIDMIKDLSEAEYYELMTYAKKRRNEEYGDNGAMTHMGVGFDNRNGRVSYPDTSMRMMAPYGMASQYDEDDRYEDMYRRPSSNKGPDNVYRGVRFAPGNGGGRFDVNEAVSSIKEMWSDADPSSRKELKTNLERLISEM